MTEHRVDFGIVIDDDEIREQVMANITKQVSSDILKKLDKNPGDLPTKSKGYLSSDGMYLSYENSKVDWAKVVRYAVDEIVEEWKPDVIERAAEMLVESLKRTKKWKEKVDEALEK